jgi:all-trans-retinol 13,14-reductase
MIQSYKKNPKLLSHYDAIVIGSGMGGLTTAAVLAKEKQKVLVVERHYTAGGFTHVFKRKGFEWDVGIHYIGEVQRPTSVIRKVFDYITNGNLHWADMGEIYDRIIIGEKEYDFVKGVKNFKEQMTSYFPDEKEAIDSYVDLVFEAVSKSQKFYMDKALPPFISTFIGSSLRNPFYKFSDKTTYEVLRSLTDNDELIKVLTGQYGDYGLPPKESSFVMHAAVARHYFAGGNFPIGGSSKIAETTDQVIENAGGTILISAEVDEIIIEKNKAVGIRMKDGKEFRANKIISGAGIMNTYEKLLPSEVGNKFNLKSKLRKVNRSVAHACLYLGLEGSPEELGLPKTNYWIYPEKVDHDTAVQKYLEDINNEFPVVYISFPSAKDPDWSNRYPGKSTIDIITLVPYSLFEKWDGTSWMKRGEDYESIKENITNRLLDVLYKHVPSAKGKIVHKELSSPLTTKHFVNYDEGEIYGLDHSPKRFRQRFLKPRTPIKNLFLTGQDIVSAGVAAALFSGVITASAITGKNIIKKIMKK